jgi:hypothetical protein
MEKTKQEEHLDLNESDDNNLSSSEKFYSSNHYKYPVFFNPEVDDELKTEISIENLSHDLNAIYLLLVDYYKKLSGILIKECSIHDEFKKYKLDFFVFHINTFFLIRKIELISNLMITNKDMMRKNIEEKYLEKALDDVILIWNSENLTLFNFIDDPFSIREEFSRHLEEEKIIIENRDELPLCLIGVFMIYLKHLMKETNLNLDTYILLSNEDNMVHFFHDVDILFILVYKATYRWTGYKKCL